MKKYIFSLIFILSGSLIFTSCEEDFLDTVPTDEVSAEAAVSTTGNAYSLLNGIHRALYIRYEETQGNGGLGAHYIHLDSMGEDLVNNANTWFNRVYQWTAGSNPNDFYDRYPWLFYYRIIANANILINGIDNATGPQADIKIIKGQALVYRAFAHYQLVQLYGDRYIKGAVNSQLGVPLKLNTLELNQPRATVEDVYTQINLDLKDAITALSGYSRPNKSNINVNVAQGLKARVALTQGEWAEAATMASLARTGTSLMSQATYRAGFQIFSETNPEFMWASHIIVDQSDTFANFGGNMSRNFSSSAIRGNPRSISQTLYDKIPATDVRKSLFDATGLHTALALPSNFARYPYTSQKFIAVSTGDSRVDVPHMRAAEMFLIEAEARARNNEPVLARHALFSLISNRDASYVLSTNSGPALIDEIMIHRRVELWGEGFRFYDLKRLNQALDRKVRATGSYEHTSVLTGAIFNIPAGDKRWTWLIPQLEMDATPNMVQNPI